MSAPVRSSSPGTTSVAGPGLLPVCLDIRGKRCVVVGAGPVGTRKARTLAEAGARVAVVAPDATPELERAAAAGEIQWLRTRFRPAHLLGAFLAVAATDDPVANAAVAGAAARQGALLCDATDAGRSGVNFGATLSTPSARVAVFTDGRDPAGARRTRDRLARLLGRDARIRGDGATSAARRADALVLVAHGSRDARWRASVERVVEVVADDVGPGRVRLAYMDLTPPTLLDIATGAAQQGAERIAVLPLFLAAQGHVERDVVPLVEEVRAALPGLRVDLLPPLGQHEELRHALGGIAERVTEPSRPPIP